MNRKERRAEAKRRRAAQKATLPPAYFDDIKEASRLIYRWVQEQPTEPELRWVEQKDDGVFIAAGLDAGARLLADSPDAFRLLAWLDAETGRKLSLNQATWALRACRALPMPDGSYWGAKETRESVALRSLRRAAASIEAGKGSSLDAMAVPSPCGHCGKVLDGASGAHGEKPKPGDVSVCMSCTGANTFGEDLRLVPLSDAEVEAHEAHEQIRAGQDLLRGILAKRMAPGRQRTPEA